MTIPLRVLILEDRPDDAELMLYELGKSEYEPDSRRVETEPDYVAALEWSPDVILADYTLPQFNAIRALHLLRERNLDIAFIVVTDSLSEEVAVNCVKQGAADYLLKDRLSRLGPAVAYALEQKKNREQRRQAEIALQYSEMLSRTILDAVRDHIAVLDRKGAIILVNEAWECFAIENDAPALAHTSVGLNYLDVCRGNKGEDQESAQAALAGIEAVLQGKQPQFSLEYPCHSPTTERWFTLYVMPMPSNLGGVVIAHRNITERKQAEERTRQQDRLAVVGQLAAGIAHDFNNILSVITLYTQLLIKAPGIPSANEERLQMINRQAQRASRLIVQIMDFSRQSMMERHPLELRTFLASLVVLLKRTLPEHILIKLSCDQRDLLINADIARIEQVFMNLAINARDAMPDGGVLQIQVSTLVIDAHQPPPVHDMPTGPWVRIAVTDAGIGIPAQNLPHIFEPFFTTKTRNKGTGLGLAQVYGIIKQHEGFIDVTSQVGQGTSFVLYLPMLVLPDVKISATPTALEIAGQGETILIVEDDRVTREATAAILQLLHYQVLTARNGKEALTIFDEQGQTIDLVLSDMVMPGMDGISLYKRLTELRPDVKVIIMTGYAPQVRTQDLIKTGIIDWLPKPFDIDKVALVLHKALYEDTSKSA